MAQALESLFEDWNIGIQCPCSPERVSKMRAVAETLVKQKRQDANRQSFGKQGAYRSLDTEINDHLTGLLVEENWFNYLQLKFDPLTNSQQYRTKQADLTAAFPDGYIFRAEIRSLYRSRSLIVRPTDTIRRDDAEYILYGDIDSIVGCCELQKVVELAEASPEFWSNPNGGTRCCFLPVDKLLSIQSSPEQVRELLDLRVQ